MMWSHVLSFVGPGAHVRMIIDHHILRTYVQMYGVRTCAPCLLESPSLLVYGLDIGMPPTRGTCGAALAAPGLDLVTRALRCGASWTRGDTDTAVALGRLDAMDLPEAQLYRGHVATAAARVGNIDALEWAYLHGELPDWCSASAAAATGRIDVLRYLWGRKCPFNQIATATAARHGQLRALAWLRAHGCPWGVSSADEAALAGRTDTLRWILANSGPVNAGTLAIAAENGSVECMTMLRAAGCAWTPCVCTSAARNGHVRALEYAHEGGCPWDATAFSAAARAGNLNTMQWLLDADCPRDAGTTAAAVYAGLEVVQWCRAHGFPWDATTLTAARWKHVDPTVLKWCVENGCPAV
jgi:hypothetical protein